MVVLQLEKAAGYRGWHGTGTHLQTAEQPARCAASIPPGQGLPPGRDTGHTQEGTQGSKKRMKKLCQAEQDQVEGVKEMRTRNGVE